ncbi:hypothetical protein DY000_02021246 [Brassica cretica]|uniref:Uncharacterized protein n=1 Tax=Brassica cretica TaxID=69181 RepID=A0ABQ7EGD0_BRACR|nr:hypothetical protein DY000_02021246 [Brassica cretica]
MVPATKVGPWGPPDLYLMVPATKVGPWVSMHGTMEGGTWPEQIVDLSICCSEHDVSRRFSEHGGTLLMSWRSWPEPINGPLGAKPCLGGCRVDELWSWTSWTSFFREVICIGILPLFLGSWETHSCPSWYLIKGRFPFILRQDKSFGLEAGGRTQARRQGPGTWRTSARSMGHQTPLSIVLRCTCGRYERIHSLIGDISPGEWAIILDPMQRRVDRRFDGEAGSVCIKGDASAHTPDVYAASVAILGLSSGRTSVCIP